MKVIVFLAFVAAGGLVGFWIVNTSPELVRNVRESFGQESANASTGRAGARTPVAVAVTPRPTIVHAVSFATLASPTSFPATSTPRRPVTVDPEPTAMPTPTRTSAAPPQTSRGIPFRADSSIPAGVSADLVNAMRNDMHQMINLARQRAGVAPVTLGRNMSPQHHAEYMRDNCVVSHRGHNGSSKRDRWLRAGGNPAVILGENVSGWRDGDWTVPSRRTLYYYVDDLFVGLMDSPGHRENILDRDYDEVHLGFAISRSGMWVTQLFVDRR